MSQTSDRVKQSVSSIGRLVERDGGNLKLASFDDVKGLLDVEFSEGPEQYCSVNGECTFTLDTVRSLLGESLKSQGLADITLSVRDVTADATA